MRLICWRPEASPDLNSRNRILWLILVVALGLRVATAVVVDRYVQAAGRQFLIEGDANGYWELGNRLATGQAYCIHQPPRYVLRTPGFPLLLAASIRGFGPSILAASVLLAVVGTACVWLTWRLARWCLSAEEALAAAAIAAVSPLQVGNSVLILSETWFAFWLLICLLALCRLIPGTRRASAIEQPVTAVTDLAPAADGGPASGPDRPAAAVTSAGMGTDVFWATLSGLLTGVTVLVRPGWILWTGVSALLVFAFGCGSRRRRLGLGVLIGIGCLLALTPWAWRNFQVTGHWIFTSLWSGPSLYDGLHPGATGASDMSFVDQETVYATFSEYAANAHYKQRAWDFVRQNPGRTLQLAVIKAGRYLSLTPNATGFSGGPVSLICLVFYAVLCVLLIMGVNALRDRPALLALLLAPFLQFLLVHMVFVGSVRYRLPVEFSLLILAAAGLRDAVRRLGIERPVGS